MYFLPESLYNVAYTVQPDNWAQAGFTPEEKPACFTELLDLAERWADMVKGGSMGRLRLFTDGKYYDAEFAYTYSAHLTQILLDCWEIQCQHAGKPIRYNDSEFIALADRCREVGRKLGKAEKKPTQKSVPLIASAHGTDDGMLPENIIPFRVHAAQPPLVNTRATLFAVRKGSPYAEACKDFLAWHMEQSESYCFPRYESCPEAFSDVPLGQYKEAWRDSSHFQSERWHETYNPEWAHLWIVPGSSVNAYYSATESLRRKFAHGEISAETLARELDRRIFGE